MALLQRISFHTEQFGMDIVDVDLFYGNSRDVCRDKLGRGCYHLTISKFGFRDLMFLEEQTFVWT